MKFILFISILSILLCCKSVEQSQNNIESSKLNKTNFDSWHHSDLTFDSIPGISLEKWYKENKSLKSKNQIIVAVLDTQIDLNHEDLQGQLWVNKKEISNNNIDDDKNGYIDDVNGWNFLGTKSGNYIVWSNFDYVRIVRKWKTHFENKKKEDIIEAEKVVFDDFKKAKSMLEYKQKYYSAYIKAFDYLKNIYPKSSDTLKHYFPNGNYGLNQLDSLYKKYKINDKSFPERQIDKDEDFGALIDYMYICHLYNCNTIDKLNDKTIQYDSILNKNLNIEYNERLFIGDNENVLEKDYGHNKIYSKISGIRSFNNHSTKVSSIIAANRNNNIGIKGFSNNIKIMPLVVSCSGDEYDKDIVMAIYYAVDNGAKVINMSFGKEFSLNNEIVLDALKYAEKNNVLICHSSGNEALNIDEFNNFPNDINKNKKEISDNFIKVGSISKKVDSSLISSFSNFGKQNVDLFAPGDDIYTCIADNGYEIDGGTSLAAPMVSGTAALIWLYYPNLSVQEVKQIILESGVTIDKKVIKPGTKDEMVSFSELCKSGKILNTYNAMQMAKQISGNKKSK